MKKVLLFSLFAIPFISHSQVISQFTWNSTPVTTADVGPNATSVSGSATSSTGGAGGTNGLNAGTPKANLNFIIPTGSGIFDVNGIDISIDYQRDESVGNFLDRGSSLILKAGNKFAVTYRVDDGVGGYTTITSGDVYNVINDNTFRTFRFVYTPSDGVGELFVNGVSQWSDDGPDNRNLYWTGAGDITIGKNMDGSGSNRAFFDNLIIQEVEPSGSLPIELGSFNAYLQQNNKVKIDWVTITEINNNYFTIEKSKNANTWDLITHMEGAGNSSETLNYSCIDNLPYSGTSYYRLKQTDYNGDFSYSDVVMIKNKKASDLIYYPNPIKNVLTVYSKNELVKEFSILNSNGKRLVTRLFTSETESIKVDMSDFSPGIYYLQTINGVSVLLKE